MSIFDWLFKKTPPAAPVTPMSYSTGAIVSYDAAPMVFSDIVGTANVVDWSKSTYRSFPALNQNRSFMCGAFAARKHLGICYAQKYGNYIDFSEEDIYQRRANRNNSLGSAGMSFPDMFSILAAGVTLKALTNVAIQTDADADTCVIDPWKRDPVGKAFAISQGIYIPAGDFETIASVIQTTGKSVIALMYFTAGEWSLQCPQIFSSGLLSSSSNALVHFVNFVDFCTIGGVQYLVTDDSAWFGGYNTRFVSRQFLQARNVPVSMANAYAMTFKFDVSDPKKIHFDGSIVSLQLCLRSLGCFPVNVATFENVGPTTQAALAKFQAVNGLPVTSAFDDSTRATVTRMFP